VAEVLKSALFFCLDGAHSDVTLRVSRGGPGTDHEGLCVVRMTQATVGDGPWQEQQSEEADGDPITALESGHSEFLNEEAVALIGPHDDEESSTALALHLHLAE